MVKSITSFMEKAYCTYRKKLQTTKKLNLFNGILSFHQSITLLKISKNFPDSIKFVFNSEIYTVPIDKKC
jgi:hypothetical protein